MSEIQDEAYTELCIENDRLRANAEQANSELRSLAAENKRLRELLERCTDDLEEWNRHKAHYVTVSLIKEARAALKGKE